MDAQQILDFARDQANVTDNEFTNDRLLPYLNISYHDVENDITTQVSEDFFYDIWTTDLITNQNEYIWQESSAVQLWFKKIVQVEIKYRSNQDYFEKLLLRSVNLFPDSREYLAERTPESSWFFDIKDSSLWIYPVPTEDVTNGLKVSTITNMVDLTTTSTEEEVYPDHTDLRQRHYIIGLWIVPYILRIRWQVWEKQEAQNDYRTEKRKMVAQLKWRYDTFQDAVLPSPAWYTL